ncbi:transposase [Streptomyces sp. NPDC087226]|uniref:transposase n=1 Tax=Streptomyces sp. NPDC087226 TaxID=3365771 RepID=UPI00382B85AF
MGSRSDRSRPYTGEFKRDAVALVRSSGRTATEVARRIGVGAEGLRNRRAGWTSARGRSDPGTGPSAPPAGAPGRGTLTAQRQPGRPQEQHPRRG